MTMTDKPVTERLQIAHAQLLYTALREIELEMLIGPCTEREKRIYSIACAALNLYEGLCDDGSDSD